LQKIRKDVITYIDNYEKAGVLHMVNKFKKELEEIDHQLKKLESYDEEIRTEKENGLFSYVKSSYLEGFMKGMIYHGEVFFDNRKK
jgi:flagellar biosynthesis chaperone FliJ